MIRPASLGLQSDVLPQAIFWRPLIYFATSFRTDEDGLDKFKVMTFVVDNNLTFDLRNYRGHPAETSTMYLPFEIQDLDLIVSTITEIMSEIGIPKYAVAWQRGWDFEFGSLRRQEADRLREPEARILALKIASRAPRRTASTELIKQEVPRYYPLSVLDRRPSPSRKGEELWQQIVGNVISHQKTAMGLFGRGYATRTEDGLSVTDRGVDYLNSIGFSV